ncbi:MAG: hypothetical protein ACLT0Y_03455 [Christensenellales bacterium]
MTEGIRHDFQRTVFRLLQHGGAILTRAAKGNATERELQQIVLDTAFSESVLSILPSLKSGKWPLLRHDMTSVLRNPPSMPLTTLEKRWLKSIAADPRIQLFHIQMPNLDDVAPLFTRKDYKIYDNTPMAIF